MLLKKYQRDLIPYFKKYQLPELEGDAGADIDAEDRITGPESYLVDNEENEKMLEKQRTLLSDILESFDKGDSKTDLAILFKVTGFQANIPDDEDFWVNFGNYKANRTTETNNLLALSKNPHRLSVNLEDFNRVSVLSSERSNKS